MNMVNSMIVKGRIKFNQNKLQFTLYIHVQRNNSRKLDFKSLKEMTSQTVRGFFSNIHLVACMESNKWLVNCCLVDVLSDG